MDHPTVDTDPPSTPAAVNTHTCSNGIMTFTREDLSELVYLGPQTVDEISGEYIDIYQCSNCSSTFGVGPKKTI
jgi:hypothetical protein